MATVTRPEKNCETGPCPACRGRGYKLKGSCRALLIGTGGEGAEEIEERKCLDCLGEGQAERNER
ncbi:hypothetical protein GCM10012278_13590 [Nonomuraea glycinis]|jgi:hypothetical protein|uniref:Uncharacterized protein n=1 Tax=Nonomuraea glycinis TaxID=2047744 RepID=A0A918A0Z2_9ACTN|nr:hypothetical protein GCM10012278_13590 [Nonomuraea glycinis]